MKKRFLLLSSLLAVMFGIGTSKAVSVNAEEITPECSVVLEETNHGSIVADKTEGSVGEIVTLTVENDFLYLIDNVSVNGTGLVESETTKGEYTFALVSGENRVTAKFVVDEETLGVFATMYQEISEKDWTNLFSVENIITIVRWLFDGGLLIAIVRFSIKDKRTAEKVEKAIPEAINKALPEASKEIITENISKVLEPVFTNLASQMSDVSGAIASLTKCMALAQENTPESRQAIIEELSKVKISDATTLAEVKKYVADAINTALKTKEETLSKLKTIVNENKKIVEQKEEHSKEVKGDTYDGTSI